MKLLLGFGLSFLLLSSALVSSAVSADEAISSQKTANSEEALQFKTVILTGFGSFNDVQIPMNYDGQVRLDGILAEPESQTQGGSLLGLRLELASTDVQWQWISRFEAARLANLTTNINNADSSFSALELETGLRFITLSREWMFEALMGAANHYYTNISSGHEIKSYYPKFAVRWIPTLRSSVGAYVAPSLNPEFMYNRGDKSFVLDRTKTSVMTVGGDYAYRLTNASALSFGLKHTMADVLIESIQTYETAGFNVWSPDADTKRLRLSTLIASVGFVTDW